MKIQVLGSGCATCKKLHEVVLSIVDELRLKAEVHYLTGDEGTSKIVEMGIMSSPVLVIDDKPVMVGFTPNVEKIKNLILKHK
jgi:small redox-active disulfide protein 2